MDDTDMLARLREEVAALRQELAGARAQLDAAAGRSSTMRRDGRCPGCGGRRLLAVAEVLDRHDGGARKLSLARRGMFRERPLGQFQLMVCTGCNLVEWSVKDLKDVPIDGEKVRLVDETTPEGGDPYR